MDICISSWSFHTAIENRLLTTLDFPAFCRHEFGVRRIEFHDPDFFYGPEGMPKGTGVLPADAAHLEQVNKACKDAGVSIVAIAAQNDFTNPDEEERREDIRRVEAWIDIAESVGAKIIRINSGIWFTLPGGEGVDRLKRALQQLVSKAKEKGVVLAIENHPRKLNTVGEAEDIINTAMDLADASVSTWPDNGHIEGSVRFECLDALFTTAKHCHVKFYDFDDAGNETAIDYEKFFDVARRNSYEGSLSVELLPRAGAGISLVCSKVTQHTLEELRESGVSGEVVKKLESLEGEVFCSRRELDDALGQTLSREELSAHRPLLPRHMQTWDPDFERRKDLTRRAVDLLLRHGAEL